MVCGMPSISLSKNEICKGSMLGKNIKKTFPRSDNRAQGILDLVHSDVCLVYIHVPKEKRTKMEPLGKKGALWDTTRTPRLTGYMYQVRSR
jgi:hypothetical protein